MPDDLFDGQMLWDGYRCGICGGAAYMAVMSLVARCTKCGAYSVEVYPPKKWAMPCAEGAD